MVSRGGRPDLVTADLQAVQAPTPLVVGAHDPQVLQLNRHAIRLLRCQKRLEVVPGTMHLFEEPGALDTVADLAGAWFAHYFSTAWRSWRAKAGRSRPPPAGIKESGKATFPQGGHDRTCQGAFDVGSCG